MARQSRPKPAAVQVPRSWLERLIAPLPLNDFIEDSFTKAPLHISGTRGRFRELLDWDGLARLFEIGSLEPPRFSVIKSGKTIPGERYLRRLGGISRIDSGALKLLLDTGATAIINHVDDLVPAVAELADEVGDYFHARTAVNLYATWRSERGFEAHADYHDVIVLQLAGRKEWPIYKPTRTDPLRGDRFEAAPAGAKPHQVVLLEDGDVLYLPRGWIHSPAPVGEPSLHLTIAITRPTGAGFLEWLAHELRRVPEVRAALPLADDAALTRWKRRMAEIVNEAIEGGMVERFQREKDAARGARPRFSFPSFGRLPADQWDSRTRLRPSSLHCFPVEMGTDGTARLSALGHSWPCSAAVGRSLQRVTSTRPVELGELEAGLVPSDSAHLRELLGALATMGLLDAESA